MKETSRWVAAVAAAAVGVAALACGGGGGEWESFPNTFTAVSRVETTNPFQFEVGQAFIDSRNTEFGAYVVAREVDADGNPGEVRGAQFHKLGSDEAMLVHLDRPLRTPSTRLHVSVVVDEPYNGQWDPSDPVVTAGGEPMEQVIEVDFESTVANPDSPFYGLTCGMGQVRSELHLANKTGLDYDCRCTLPTVGARSRPYDWDSEAELMAQRRDACELYAYEGNAYSRGEGPQGDALGGSQTAGDVWHDRGEIVFGMKWSTSQDRKLTLMALDYTTGDRRVVSGVFRDPATGDTTTGEGPLPPSFAAQVRRGPDGRAYVITQDHKILAVDVETGEREMIWEWGEEGYAQCDNGVQPEGHPDWRLGDGQNRPLQLTVEGRGFVVAPDGSFYAPTLANGSPAPGYGVVRIAADGSSCEHVSMSPGDERNAYAAGIGSGWETRTPIETMVWHEGKLIGITVFSHTLEIDPQTGDRVRLAGQGLSGSPSLAKVSRMFWDDARQVFFLSGFIPPSSPNFASWDPETNAAYAYMCSGIDEDHPFVSECASLPMNSLLQSSFPAYLRPDGMIVVGFARTGFLLYEIETGNNHWFSY